jgi:hypothetical protein
VEYIKTASEIHDSRKRSADFTGSINFFAGGVVNLYQGWFHGGRDYAVNEIAPDVSKIIKNTSSSSFDVGENH